mmetsp:Transcript_1363/g.2378  ORF Transcript_1363/g.2378 Transcript_1363/m.2378 type:complete len:225 (+) Transcript_1363:165-839(+)
MKVSLLRLHIRRLHTRWIHDHGWIHINFCHRTLKWRLPLCRGGLLNPVPLSHELLHNRIIVRLAILQKQNDARDVVSTQLVVQPLFVALLQQLRARDHRITTLGAYIDHALIRDEFENTIRSNDQYFVPLGDFLRDNLWFGIDTNVLPHSIPQRPREGRSWIIVIHAPHTRRIAMLVNIHAQINLAPILVHGFLALHLIDAAYSRPGGLETIALVLAIGCLILR